MHEELMGFVNDEASYRIARSVVEGRGLPAAVIQQGGLELLADMLENNAPPKVVLLDLDGEKDLQGAAQRASSLCGPDCRIIFLGRHNDVSLYRQLIQLGAADYLVKPIAEDTLTSAIANAAKSKAAQNAGEKEAKGSGIIPVIGARGGVGVTTIAVNLAWIIAQQLGKHACVLDLDMQFGTSALALDHEPGRGMRAALENPERLDGLLIASSLVQVQERLSLLCAQENLEQPFSFEGEATLGLIKPVREDFDYILVDMPRHLLASQKKLLMEAHQVILLADLTLASLRDARRIRAYLKTLRPDLLPLLVINHVGESPYATLAQATFEKNMEAKIDLFIPEDIKTAKQAANLGKAFAAVAADAPVTKALTGLARLLCGLKEEAKTEKQGGAKSIFDSLLGGKPAKPVSNKPVPQS